MDDILKNIKQSRIQNKLQQNNNLHPSLKFIVKTEIEKSIAWSIFLNLAATFFHSKCLLSGDIFNEGLIAGLLLELRPFLIMASSYDDKILIVDGK